MRGQRFVRYGILGVVGLVTAVTSGCGGVDVLLTSTPVPAQLGLPLTYNVEITNTLTCDETDPEIVLVPLVQQDQEFNFVCSLIQAGSLEAACAAVNTIEEAQAVASICCTLTDFAETWPSVCESTPTAPSAARVQQQTLADILNKRGIQVNAAPAPAGTEMPKGPFTCSISSVSPILADCTGTIPAGQSVTIPIAVTPTMVGTFGTLAFVGASASCGPNEGASGGACVSTTVTAAAPSLSGPGLFALALLLTAGGLWRIRGLLRRRRG
jgi:hypothetical protein